MVDTNTHFANCPLTGPICFMNPKTCIPKSYESVMSPFLSLPWSESLLIIFCTLLVIFLLLQIGNCVGAANHRSFILFLISTVTSMMYVSFISAYSALHIWPPLDYRTNRYIDGLNIYKLDLTVLKEATFSFLRSAVFITPRGLVLVYLFIASVAVQIGLSVLLWQQLCYIYKGKTYLSNLSSSSANEEPAERDCQNFVQFFGCHQYTASRYFPNFLNSRKTHDK